MIKKANFNKNNNCNNFCCTKIENFSVTIGNNEILKDVNLHIHCIMRQKVVSACVWNLM